MLLIPADPAKKSNKEEARWTKPHHLPNIASRNDSPRRFY